MRAKLRVAGNDGSDAYKAGDECTRDSEWFRRMLVNGLAEPLDGEARNLAYNPASVERYRSEALAARALELGLQPRDVPALSVTGG